MSTKHPTARRTAMIILAVIGLIFLWLLAALILMASVRPSNAHSIYHYECCHDRDCWPLEDVEIRETPEGWLLVETGEVIPYDWPKVKDSPDGRYHLCTTTGDFTGMKLCLYRPPLGF
jgi:hypothetical protein